MKIFRTKGYLTVSLGGISTISEKLTFSRINMYSYVWEYRVKLDFIGDFKSSYGANGEWVNLFNRHPAFIRTELLKDQKDPMRFLTIDTWKSREQYLSFRKEFQKEYDAIDNKCEAFTLNEQSLGEFDLQQ